MCRKLTKPYINISVNKGPTIEITITGYTQSKLKKEQ